MHTYLITIRLQGGTYGRCHGVFANDWTAIDTMMDTYHDARRISVRRLA